MGDGGRGRQRSGQGLQISDGRLTQGPDSRRQQKRTVSPLAADPTELVVIWVFLKKLRLWGSFKATRRFEKRAVTCREGGLGRGRRRPWPFSSVLVSQECAQPT